MTAIEDCPECGASLEVPDEQVGDRVECPDCGKKYVAKAIKRQRPADADDDYEDRPTNRFQDRPSDRAVKDAASKKLVAGLCGILVGAFGIHKFILGQTTAGIIMLLVTVLTCGMGGAVMGVIGLVEGILYLVKSDEEFYRVYVVEKKEWF